MSRVVGEKQLQALAKARAVRKQKLAAERALAAQREEMEPRVAAAYEQARVAEVIGDVEAEAQTLRLEFLLQQALDSVGVRRADGSGQMHDRCTLCQEKGVHHVTPMLCDCWCHKAREVLGGVARAA